MNKYIVYIHTNKTNGKKYIGITCKEPNERWKNGKGYKGQRIFYSAICKYGWENINHEVLFDNLTKLEAETKEKELIAKYKTNVYVFGSKYGYNSTNGGDSSRVNIKSKSKYEGFAVKGFEIIDHTGKRVTVKCLKCGKEFSRTYGCLVSDHKIKCECMKKPKAPKKEYHYITFNNETLTITEWCKKMNIARKTIYNRLEKGMTIEEVLKPKQKL